MKRIKIKYFARDITPIEAIEKGNWIDLRNASDNSGKYETGTYGLHLLAGQTYLVHLGVGMILPKGYEAHIAPRSSTFKKFGLLLTNSVGVIDNSYSGNNDEWLAMVLATRDCFLPYNERFMQFRIMKIQPKIRFIEVDKLNDKDRGGYGSTGGK